MKRTTKKVLDKVGNVTGSAIKATATFFADVIKDNIKWVLLLGAFFWFYENHVDLSILKSYANSTFSKFEEGEVAKVKVDCRDNTAITHTKGQTPKLYTGVKYFEGKQFQDGKIKTKFKNKGLGLEPGIVATAGDGLRLGLDLEWIYWRRWGIVTGATYPVSNRSLDRVRGHTGLSYDLPTKWLSNTSIYAGVDSDKTPTVGFRTKIGGGI